MTLTVVKAGLQTTLQATPYKGLRNIGMPSAGAADSLSFMLANKLVGKCAAGAAIEITLSDAKFRVDDPCTISVTGAADFVRINDKLASMHRAISVEAGDEIHIGPANPGCRSYLAIDRILAAESLLGEQSTYLAAGLGGFLGRALGDGDIMDFRGKLDSPPPLSTPTTLIPSISDKFIIRITAGPELEALSEDAAQSLLATKYIVGRRSDRMGLALTGAPLTITNAKQMKSAPVFPGIIQCPPDGTPFLLGPDAQTTGGYPRVAHVIRADRHLIGQVRPGSEIQLVMISSERATDIYRKKLALLSPWLGNTVLW